MTGRMNLPSFSFFIIWCLLGFVDGWKINNVLDPYLDLPLELGKEMGIASYISTELSPATLQKIVDGVESGNKESIYYFGLLKLYGLSLSKNETIAAASFKRAGDLGHVEGMTAYAVMVCNGIGIEKDLSLGEKWLMKAVQRKDINAHWLLAK